MNPRFNQDPARLRRRRVAAGLSLTAMAERAGVSKSHASQVENGRVGASPDVLRRFAEVLECEISDLMPPEQVPAP